MRATRISPWVLVLSIAAVVPSASDVRAADHDFTTNLVYRLLSVEEVNGQLVIEAEGTGQSSLFGTVTATATVTQSLSQDTCLSYSADFHLSVTAGTIQIHSGGTVCPPPSQITGEWTVTGGTGAFLRATGFGTEEGKQSFTGNDPVVDRLRGTLSYEEPGTHLSCQDCNTLRYQYDQAFREATASCPLKNWDSQCKVIVANQLVCGCGAYADISNHRALEILRAVQQAFCDGGCVSGCYDCTASLCGWGPSAPGCVDVGAQERSQ
jgi:hypothetical protein